MKAAFLQCMKNLYPQGVSREQLRDLIHCFSMGWAESFRHAVETEQPPVLRELRMAAVASAVEAWQQDVKQTAELGWMPDESWQWWEAAAKRDDSAEENRITMIDGVELKTDITLSQAPHVGMLIPHLGPITKATCYSRSSAGVARCTVQTEQHSCQP